MTDRRPADRAARVHRHLVASVVGCGLIAAAPAPATVDRGKPNNLIRASFHRRSYSPGDSAKLIMTTTAPTLTVEIFRAGSQGGENRGNDRLGGAVVSKEVIHRNTPRKRPTIVRMRLGRWPSGLYFARVDDGRHRTFAPFVLRPERFGGSTVAVVLPTNTWQAYNREDGDGDGLADTWYARPSVKSVDLTRPYVDRGVPPHFRQYDLGFLRWVVHKRKRPDFLADDDLERFSSGKRLAALYNLIVFPGHEEYVTAHAYTVIERYRDLGGNLVFLSANDLYHRVERRGRRLYRAGTWRKLGRPEARLIGVQYLGSYRQRFPNAPYVVTGAARAPWLFRETGLENGDRFGRYGIEIDARAKSSPSNVEVVATIPNVFGSRRSAEMTFYIAPSGAKVFAAGALNFGGTADHWPVSRLLENVWRRLTKRDKKKGALRVEIEHRRR